MGVGVGWGIVVIEAMLVDELARVRLSTFSVTQSGKMSWSTSREGRRYGTYMGVVACRTCSWREVRIEFVSEK